MGTPDGRQRSAGSFPGRCGLLAGAILTPRRDDPARAGYGYPQAAGAKGGPELRLPKPFVFPPKVAITDHEQHLILNVLHDYAALGVYLALIAQTDFQTGRGLTHYTTLEPMGQQPRPERGGRRRQGVTRDMLRRIVADLELVGLLSRDRAGNFANGQLHFVLPYRAYLHDEWKKTLAQRNKAPKLAPIPKARKAA